MKLVSVAMFFIFSVAAQADVDFLAFTEVRADHVEGANFSEKNITPSIDLFLSGEFEHTIFLVEAFGSEDEQEIERLQLGLKIGDTSRIWLGRYHNPFGYWHTEYHHGTYLQTSISRPGLVNLSDEGGIMPSHFTGGLVEGSIEQGESAWHYSLAVGLTSQLIVDGEEAELIDLDILYPKAAEHELGYTVRLSYQPNLLEETQFGAFISHETLKTDDSLRGEITLDVAGVFVNYQQEKLRLISEAYYFSTEVPRQGGTGHQTDDFIAAYVQAEYAVNANWTPYLRYSDTFANKGNAYLELFSEYAEKTKTLGVRWDLFEHQALKLEYTDREFDHAHNGRWLLNWSAVWR